MEGKRMKRRDFLKAGGVGLVATAGVAAPAIAQSNPEVKWRLAASWPKALDTLYGGCEYFAKRVAEITDNRFQIQSFAAGELVPGLQVLDAVSNGTVEMGNTALYYYWGTTQRARSMRTCPGATLISARCIPACRLTARNRWHGCRSLN